MPDEQAIYIGNAKIRTEPFWVMKVSFTAEDIQKLQDGLQNGWVNVDFKERRAPSAKGFTHYGQINTWKPEGAVQEGNSGPTKSAPKKTSAPTPVATEDLEEISAEDLPF